MIRNFRKQFFFQIIGPKVVSGFRIRGWQRAYSRWNGQGKGSRVGQQGKGTDEGRVAEESKLGKQIITGDRKQVGFQAN